MTVTLRRYNNEAWLLPVRVTPKGGRDIVLPLAQSDTAVRLKVSAPPEKGEANRAVERLLSDVLGVPKSSVAVIKGETAREKQVALWVAWSPEELRRRLAQATQAEPEWFEPLN